MLVCIQLHICVYLWTQACVWQHMDQSISDYLYQCICIRICICISHDHIQVCICLHTRLYLAIHRSMFDDTQSCICPHTGLCLTIHCSVSDCILSYAELDWIILLFHVAWTEVTLCYSADCWAFKVGLRWLHSYEWCLVRNGWKTRLFCFSLLLHVDTGPCRQFLFSEVVRLVKWQLRAPRGRKQNLLGQLSLIPSWHQLEVQDLMF